MYDHVFKDATGQTCTVSELPTPLIHALMVSGVVINDDSPRGLTEESVMERLRIELVARQLEGRL